MTSPDGSAGPRRDEIADVIATVAREAQAWLEALDGRPVLPRDFREKLATFDERFPEAGIGTSAALRQLLGPGLEAAVGSAGGRCFHFVLGGVTPAALGAVSTCFFASWTIFAVGDTIVAGLTAMIS